MWVSTGPLKSEHESMTLNKIKLDLLNRIEQLNQVIMLTPTRNGYHNYEHPRGAKQASKNV